MAKDENRPAEEPEEHAPTESGHGNGHTERGGIVAGAVMAEQVRVNGIVGVSRAEQDTTIKGASAVVFSGNDANVTGGAGAFVSRGGMTVTGGGGPVLVSGGDMDVARGGGGLLVARRAVVRDGGVVGVALAREMDVRDGGRVLITGLAAVLMGVAAGAAFAVVRQVLTSATTRRRPWRRSPIEQARAELERRARRVARKGERLMGKGEYAAQRGMRDVRRSAHDLAAQIRR